MNYIVYKTTCLINTKIYIGIHQQETLDFDGYLGSGLLLNRAVEKYGRDNFLRETLFVCHTLKECRDKERQIVNLEFCQRDHHIKIWEHQKVPDGYVKGMITNKTKRIK